MKSIVSFIRLVAILLLSSAVNAEMGDHKHFNGTVGGVVNAPADSSRPGTGSSQPTAARPSNPTGGGLGNDSTRKDASAGAPKSAQDPATLLPAQTVKNADFARPQDASTIAPPMLNAQRPCEQTSVAWRGSVGDCEAVVPKLLHGDSATVKSSKFLTSGSATFICENAVLKQTGQSNCLASGLFR